MKLFLTSFFQIALVAMNTVLITKGYVIGIFGVSFMISYLWTMNVAKISVSTQIQKLTYATGAGCGAVCGYLIVNSILH